MTAPGNHSHLDVEYHSAGLGPGQTVGHPGPLTFVLRASTQITRRTQERLEIIDADGLRFRSLARGSVHLLPSDLSGHARDPTIELSHTGLASVLPDDTLRGVLGECHVTGIQPVTFGLLWPQESESDGQFFSIQISRKSDDLHAVTKWVRDAGQGVGRRHEEHIGEVVFQLEVVVFKALVLLRIQHLE